MVTCTLACGVPNLEEIGFFPYTVTVNLSELVSSFYIIGTAYSISHYLRANTSASEITGLSKLKCFYHSESLDSLTNLTKERMMLSSRALWFGRT